MLTFKCEPLCCEEKRLAHVLFAFLSLLVPVHAQHDESSKQKTDGSSSLFLLFYLISQDQHCEHYKLSCK